VCIACSGLLFDADAVADISKKVFKEYRSIYGESMPLENFCDQMSSIFHQQTISGTTRTLGICLVAVGIDAIRGAQVYSVHPDGSYSAWKALAVGKHSDKLQASLLDMFGSTDGSVKSVSETLPLLMKHVTRVHFSNPIISLAKKSENEENETMKLFNNMDIDVGSLFKPYAVCCALSSSSSICCIGDVCEGRGSQQRVGEETNKMDPIEIVGTG
jgi:20S proteasome alpha/beta subunit